MDPDTALNEIRELIAAEQEGDDVDASTSLDRLDALMEKFQALDFWLARGGFLPKEWQR